MLINSDQARAVTYLDFKCRAPSVKGEKFPSPNVVGQLVEGEYSFIVLDPKLEKMAKRVDWEYVPLIEFLAVTWEECVDERNRLLVCFLGTAKRVFGESGYDTSDAIFDLSKPVLRRWSKIMGRWINARRVYIDPRSTENAKKRALRYLLGPLAQIAEEIGFERPAGDGSLASLQALCDLSPTQHTYSSMYRIDDIKKTTEKFHRFDCEAMEFILSHLLEESEDGEIEDYR